MTAVSDIKQPALETPVGEAIHRSRTRVVRRLFVAFLIGLALSLMLAAAALVAWDLSYEGRVLPGVRVGATDLSGLDRAGATAALEQAYNEYGEGRVLISTIAGDVAVDYSTFARRADVGALVDTALWTGRDGSVVERVVGEVRLALNGASLEPTVVFDEAALRAAIAAGLTPLEARPIDAEIGMGPRGVRVFHSRPGWTFDVPAVQSSALALVGSANAPPEIPIKAAAIPVEPDRSDEDVLQAQKAATWVGKAVIVKGAGGRWKIPAAKVRSWITFTTAPGGALQPVVDEAAIPKALRTTKKDVARTPVSAQYLRSKSGSIFGVIAGHDGRKLDTRQRPPRSPQNWNDAQAAKRRRPSRS